MKNLVLGRGFSDIEALAEKTPVVLDDTALKGLNYENEEILSLVDAIRAYAVDDFAFFMPRADMRGKHQLLEELFRHHAAFKVGTFYESDDPTIISRCEKKHRYYRENTLRVLREANVHNNSKSTLLTAMCIAGRYGDTYIVSGNKKLGRTRQLLTNNGYHNIEIIPPGIFMGVLSNR